MKKQLLSLMMMLLPMVAMADASGNAGTLTWTYTESTKTLSIEGNGAIPNYNESSNKSPWRAYPVEKIIIGDGVTSIGNFAFYNMKDVTDLYIPNSVTNIGEYNQEIKGVTNVEIIPVSA